MEIRVVCKSWNALLALDFPAKPCSCALCRKQISPGTASNWPDLIESSLRLLGQKRGQLFFSFDDIITFIDEHWLNLWNPNIENLGNKTKGWQQVIGAVLKVKQDIFEVGKEGFWAVRTVAPLNVVGVALSAIFNPKRKFDEIDRDCRGKVKRTRNELVELSALALASLEELQKQDSDDESNDSNASPKVNSPEMEAKDRKESNQQKEHNFINDVWVVRPQLTSNPDAASAEAVEVRSGRFVGVSLKDISVDKKRLFIAWTPCNNGLPGSCRLLVPSVGNYFSLSFKTKGRGWVELTCKKAVDPTFEIDFEMRIDPLIEADSVHRKGDATTIQFVLVDKEGSNLKRLGEAYLDVIVRSTKNHNKSLVGRIVYDNAADKPLPSRNVAPPKDPMPVENLPVDLGSYYQRHSGDQQAPMRMGLPNLQSSFTLPAPSFGSNPNQSILPSLASAFNNTQQTQFYPRPNEMRTTEAWNPGNIGNLMNGYRDSRTQISSLIQMSEYRNTAHNSDYPVFPF